MTAIVGYAMNGLPVHSSKQWPGSTYSNSVDREQPAND